MSESRCGTLCTGVVATVICACGLIGLTPAWAQRSVPLPSPPLLLRLPTLMSSHRREPMPTPIPPRRSATLAIRLDPRSNHVDVDLYVLAPRQLSTDPATGEREAREALRSAFGGNGDLPTNYRTSPYEADLYTGDGDDPYGTQSTKLPTAIAFNGWTDRFATNQGLGGDHGGPISRVGFLQLGHFNPAPVQQLLQRVGNREMKVTITLNRHDAPIARCENAIATDGPRFYTGFPNRIMTTSKRMPESVLFSAVIPTGSPYPILSFATGYSPADVAGGLIPAAAVLLGALVATIVYRARALRAFDRADELARLDPEAAARAREIIRFGFLRLLKVGVPVLSAAWCVIYILLKPMQPFLWAANLRGLEATLGWSVLSYLLPLVATVLAAAVFAIPVIRRASTGGSETASLGNMLGDAGEQLLLPMLTLLFTALGVGALLDAHSLQSIPPLQYVSNVSSWQPGNDLFMGDPLRWLAWFSLALVARLMLPLWRVTVGDKVQYQLTGGALFDRVMVLATKAGVTVKQVSFLSTGSDRTANAFAANGNLLIFTDRLLSDLSRREVDGMIAHELAHLRRRHPARPTQAQAISGLAPLLILLALAFSGRFFDDIGWPLATVIPGSTLLATAVTLAMSRRFEKEADTDAVALTGDPEGLILGLARLRHLSGLPEDWGRFDSQLLTHPSTARRIAYLTAAGKTSPDESERLRDALAKLADPAPEGDRYAPPTGTEATLVFAPLLLLRNAAILTTVILAVVAIIPCVFAHLAEIFGVSLPPHLAKVDRVLTALQRQILGVTHPPVIAAFYIAGAFATFGAMIAYINRAGTGLYKSHEPLLHRRLIEAERLTSEETQGATYVGISPGSQPRHYGGSSLWDAGYLIRRDGGLRYVGEKATFTIPAGAIADLRLSPYSSGSWIPFRMILLSERANAEGKAASLQIAPASAASLSDLRAATDDLLRKLGEWRIASGVTVVEETSPSRLPDVNVTGGATERDVAKPAMLLPGIFRTIGVTVAVAILTGLPGRGVVFCVSVATAVCLTDAARLLIRGRRAPPRAEHEVTGRIARRRHC